MATVQLRPKTNHDPRGGAVTSTYWYSTHPHRNASSRATTSLSSYRPHRSLTRAKSFPGSVSLPSLTGTASRHVSEVSFGEDARRSALRSLANNPKLAVNVLRGRVNIVSRESSPLFAKRVHDGTYQGERIEREVPVLREVPVSREAYHPRSRSPTYKALLLAKTQIEVILSKKLREVGDCEECLHQEPQPSKERRGYHGEIPGNVEACSEILHSRDCTRRLQSPGSSRGESPSALPSSRPDHPVDCLDDDTASHQTGKERLEEGGYESPIPGRPIRFGSGVLRANRGNTELLNLDEDEVARRLKKWKDDNSTNLPMLERLDSEDKFNRPCHGKLENEQGGEERFIFLKRTNRRVTPPESIKKFTRKKETKMKNHVIPAQKDITEEVQPTSLPSVIVKSSPKKIEIEDTVQTERHPPPKKALKGLEYDMIRKLNKPSSDRKKRPQSKSIDPNAVAEETEPEQAKEDDEPLTAKEKFIRMQGRMADIQRAKREKMTSFADYASLMVNKKRAQTHMKSLGSNLSKRLENMTVFQSSIDDLSGDDDDGDNDEELLMDISSDDDDSD